MNGSVKGDSAEIKLWERRFELFWFYSFFQVSALSSEHSVERDLEDWEGRGCCR